MFQTLIHSPMHAAKSNSIEEWTRRRESFCPHLDVSRRVARVPQPPTPASVIHEWKQECTVLVDGNEYDDGATYQHWNRITDFIREQKA